MTRQEHLEWCKTRALEYAERGRVADAIASMTSDLGKHPETAGHSGIPLMTMLAMTGDFERPGRLAEFIRGFQ